MKAKIIETSQGRHVSMSSFGYVLYYLDSVHLTSLNILHDEEKEIGCFYSGPNSVVLKYQMILVTELNHLGDNSNSFPFNYHTF